MSVFDGVEGECSALDVHHDMVDAMRKVQGNRTLEWDGRPSCSSETRGKVCEVNFIPRSRDNVSLVAIILMVIIHVK